MPSSSKLPVIVPLNGLRGLLAVAVVFYHFQDGFVSLMPALDLLGKISRRVAFRMDMFFILSGFLASYVYLPLRERFNCQSYLGFLKARFLRLYPSYLVVMAILILGVALGRLYGVPIAGNYPTKAILVRVLLLHAWPQFSWALWTWNYPTWFVSALFFAYVMVFPLIWWLAPYWRKSWSAYAAVASSLIAAILAVHSQQLEEFHIIIKASAEFLAGGALFVIYSDSGKFVDTGRRYVDVVAGGILLLALLLGLAPGERLVSYVNASVVMVVPFLLVGLTNPDSLSARLLSTRPMLWLGTLSYSLFLTHAVVQKIFTALLPATRFLAAPFSDRFLALGIYILGLLGAAMALHYWVEQPCRAAVKAGIWASLKQLFRRGASEKDAARRNPGSGCPGPEGDNTIKSEKGVALEK